MRALCLLTVYLLAAVACATPRISVSPAPPAPAPVVDQTPAPPPPPPAPVPRPAAAPRLFGSWPCRPSCALETAPSTNLVAIAIGCHDDVAYAAALRELAHDGRRIVWHFDGLAYGPTPRSRGGYVARDDVGACWAELLPLVRTYRTRTAWIHLADEPDSVAWGDQPATGYDPNLYNPLLEAVCARIRADVADVDVGVNYADVASTLAVPGCLTVVAVESYHADWRRRWDALHLAAPAAKLVLLGVAYTDGPPTSSTSDSVIAARLEAEVDACLMDARCLAVYVFVWCCDDTTTTPPGEPFLVAGGAQMPATRAAFLATLERVQ
jgi:hypothetical protein